ncbi:MAG: hypothetical protein ABI528_11495, partial [bacterium]
MKKWILRLTITPLLLLVILAGLVLSPSLMYANKTEYRSFTIYHDTPIENVFTQRLDETETILKSSELYDPAFKIYICLNDNSLYPQIIHAIRGDAFAFGFYDEVVMLGNSNHAENYTELNEYKWNLSELMAHEIVHCLQFNKYGLLASNPVANYPEWKWEGYPEYIARKNSSADMKKNIDRLIET